MSSQALKEDFADVHFNPTVQDLVGKINAYLAGVFIDQEVQLFLGDSIEPSTRRFVSE
jgi:hypothetical protein